MYEGSGTGKRTAASTHHTSFGVSRVQQHHFREISNPTFPGGSLAVRFSETQGILARDIGRQ